MSQVTIYTYKKNTVWFARFALFASTTDTLGAGRTELEAIINLCEQEQSRINVPVVEGSKE